MPLVALLVLGAQAATSGVQAVPVRSFSACTRVWVAASDRAVPPKDMTFSSRETLDLVFRPRLRRDLPGEHVMQLKVFTPGGFLYQVITLPFVGTAPRERSTRSGSRAASTAAGPPPPRVVPGFPRPLEVQRLQPVTRGTYELHARLPVAGTSITLSSLYGTWSVQPYLDGAARACGPATQFKIRD
jgi:hypothetical protein